MTTCLISFNVLTYLSAHKLFEIPKLWTDKDSNGMEKTKVASSLMYLSLLRIIKSDIIIRIIFKCFYDSSAIEW